jgi:hypothetical protein
MQETSIKRLSACKKAILGNKLYQIEFFFDGIFSVLSRILQQTLVFVQCTGSSQYVYLIPRKLKLSGKSIENAEEPTKQHFGFDRACCFILSS